MMDDRTILILVIVGTVLMLGFAFVIIWWVVKIHTARMYGEYDYKRLKSKPKIEFLNFPAQVNKKLAGKGKIGDIRILPAGIKIFSISMQMEVILSEDTIVKLTNGVHGCEDTFFVKYKKYTIIHHP